MDLWGANPVDVVVLVIVLASALLALMRGFVAELFTLIGLIAAAAAVLYGLPHAEPAFAEYLGKGLVAKAAAGAALFLGTLALSSALSYVISRRLRGTHLSAIDRSLGFLFGLLRGGLIVCLLYICVTFVFPPPKEGEEVKPGTLQETLQLAKTGPALAAGAGLITALAPSEGLSIEELTKPSLLDDVQPKPPESTSKEAPANSGYTEKARDELEKMINRSAP